MEKTTVYLTDEIRRGLKARAERTGSSEAHVIREALVSYLVDEPHRLPRSLGSVDLDLPDGVDSSNIKAWIRENWSKDYWAKRRRNQIEVDGTSPHEKRLPKTQVTPDP